MPWVIARLLDEQQPDNMHKPISALAEEVSKNNDPKRPKAKQIFLGTHLGRNQVARKPRRLVSLFSTYRFAQAPGLSHFRASAHAQNRLSHALECNTYVSGVILWSG
jgi:hypothetical protein